MPVQIVIDDVGWRQGNDGSDRDQPYRTGMNRLHVPEDYHAIADLGEALAIRPLAMLTLSEWDVDDRLAEIPSASWMGRQWRNPAGPFDWCEPCASVFRDRANHIEPGFHGLGHEFWLDGRMQRAEFCDRQGNPRPTTEITARFDLYAELFKRHRLGPLPTWLVPTAFLHLYAPDHPGALAAVARRYGIGAISTPFHRCSFQKPPEHPLLGFDHGLPTVDRGYDPFDWNAVGPTVDQTMLRDQPILGMHWPNLLHEDPARNGEVVRGWVDALDTFGRGFGRLLSRDSRAFLEQLLHSCFTTVTLDGQEVTLDLAGHPAPSLSLLGETTTLLLHGRDVPGDLRFRVLGGQVGRVDSSWQGDFLAWTVTCRLSRRP